MLKAYSDAGPLSAGEDEQGMAASAANAEFGRTLALETVVQWLVFRAVKQADEPQVLFDEMLSHINEQKRLIRETMSGLTRSTSSRQRDESASAIAGLNELRESLVAAIKITE